MYSLFFYIKKEVFPCGLFSVISLVFRQVLFFFVVKNYITHISDILFCIIPAIVSHE